MSWIYAFVEKNETRYTKIGVAKSDYLDRFAKSQQCNPMPMEIAAVWKFPTEGAAQTCEREIKKREIFLRWGAGGAEWFQTSPEEVAVTDAFSRLLSEFGAVSQRPLRFSGAFAETLNLGEGDSRGAAYRPHLHLITESPSTGACKFALSCYNWPTVVAHYATYNPRALSIAGRWSFRGGSEGRQFIERLGQRLLSQQINPLGWYRADPNQLIELISSFGVKFYPRSSPIDDRVNYTKFRVPI